MPHQCLKCGKVFPSGSPEILKGCNDCGGKRFFYTEKAVPDEERERLIEQANKDIKVLIREILAQSQEEKFKGKDSEDRTVPSVTYDGKSDWVKVTPPSASGEPGKIESAEAPEVVPEREHKLPTVKEILQELRGKPELSSDETSEDKRTRAKKAKIKAKRKRKVKTEDKGIDAKGKAAKAKVKPRKRKTKPRPEIITVKEPGVYDIQLDKLMKGFPIIINRDGTYLVHLPSVFESIEKDQKD